MILGQLYMSALVVEKNIRAERFQKLGLFHAAEKQGLVNTNVPGA